MDLEFGRHKIQLYKDRNNGNERLALRIQSKTIDTVVFLSAEQARLLGGTLVQVSNNLMSQRVLHRGSIVGPV